MSLVFSRNGLVIGLAITMLWGCASEQAFRDGKSLLAEGKVEEGLAQLEAASKAEPRNAEYRGSFYRQREAAINQLLTQADNARVKGQLETAEAGYRRVLNLDGNNQRAQDGLIAVTTNRNSKDQMSEAEAAYKKGDLDAAQNKLHAILVENPKNREANAMQRRIDEKNAQERIASPTLKSSFKKPITLEFRDVNLKTAFEIISRTANINFVLDKDVRPDLKTTIFVKNTTIEDALQFLLVTNQLEKKVLNDNTVLIYPNNPAKTRDYQDLVVRSFYLANADVKQTLNMLKTLLKTRDIYIDEKLNLVVMRDTPEAIRLAEKLIAMQDLAEPEVLLEVEVLEVSRSRLMELGISYPTQVGFSVVGAAAVPGKITLNEYKNRSSDLVKLSLGDPVAVLNLKKQDGDVNTLANPRIRVKNREKAKIHIGDRVPVITTTSSPTVGVSESVNYLDVGLKLDVEANVYLEDEVAIKIGLEASTIVSENTSKTGSLTYRIGSRSASTTLRLKDGETQVLAGLISDEERNSADKIPGLGDLPVLGRLFSSHKDSRNKTEIVLLITPHIVRNLSRPPAADAEFASGTEASIGAKMWMRSSEAAAPAFPGAPASGQIQRPVIPVVPVPVQPRATPPTVMPPAAPSIQPNTRAIPPPNVSNSVPVIPPMSVSPPPQPMYSPPPVDASQMEPVEPNGMEN